MSQWGKRDIHEIRTKAIKGDIQVIVKSSQKFKIFNLIEGLDNEIQSIFQKLKQKAKEMENRGEKISRLLERAMSANIQIIEIAGRKTDQKKK